MNIIRSLFFYLIFILLSCSSLAQSSFEIVINNERDEFLISGKKDFDGNFVLTGTSHVVASNRAYHYSALIMKVDTLGQYITSTLIYPDTNCGLFNVMVTNDSNYLFAGYIQPIGEDTNQLWLYKTDRSLNKIWEKRFMVPLDSGYTQCEFTSYGVETNDGNLVFGAYATYWQSNQDDMVLIKMNQQGDVLLSKQIHYQFEQQINDIVAIPNSSDILLVSNHISITGYPVRMFRLDSALNILSIQPISSSNYMYRDIGSIAYWSNDTTFLYCGDVNSLGNPNEDDEIGVNLMDTTYTVQKEILIGKPDTEDYPAYTNCIDYFNDTTIYIAGFINYITFWPEEPNQIEVYRIDTALNVLSCGTYGGNAYNRIYGIIAADDGGCLLYGSNYGEENYHEEDIYVLKVSPEDIAVSAREVKTPNPILEANVYPNSGNEQIKVRISARYKQSVIEFFDINGRLVLKENFSGTEGTANTTFLRPGTYIYKITSQDGFFESGKWVKD